MRVHRIYNDNACNRGANRTLIFNVHRYLTSQAILRAARKGPLSIGGRRISFSPDFSNFTVKRSKVFTRLWMQRELKVWTSSYFIRPLWKLKMVPSTKPSPHPKKRRIFWRRCRLHARRPRRGTVALPRLDHRFTSAIFAAELCPFLTPSGPTPCRI